QVLVYWMVSPSSVKSSMFKELPVGIPLFDDGGLGDFVGSGEQDARQLALHRGKLARADQDELVLFRVAKQPHARVLLKHLHHEELRLLVDWKLRVGRDNDFLRSFRSIRERDLKCQFDFHWFPCSIRQERT